MPAIAEQVATIEHDLAVAQTTVDSLRSENAQLKTALAALNVDHNALQAKHIDALALVDDIRAHADSVAGAALAMLKASRRQIIAPAPASEGTKALQALTLAPAVQQATDEAIAAAVEPEKTDVRPELPEAEQGEAQTDDPYAPIAAAIQADEQAMRNDMTKVLYADDGKPVRLMIDEQRDITRIADVEIPNTERLRAHMPGEEPLPIFLKPRGAPDANVLG